MRLFAVANHRMVFNVVAVLAVLTMAPVSLASAESTPPPLTNHQAAERALVKALENLGIPEGNGRIVLCYADSGAAGSEILEAAAREYILGRGYRVKLSGEFPEFRFSLDTLYVNIEQKGFPRKKTALRTAEARVGAVFRETGDIRQVYRGAGIFEDAFPSGMLDHAGRDDPYLSGGVRSSGLVKPVLFGLVITGLIWLLYSYRG